MPRVNTALTNFASGKLSKRLRGRFDLPIYYNGLENSKNFIFETQGPARFRNGTTFIAETKNNNLARLREFKFNDEQSYILEFTNTKLRFLTRDPSTGEVGFVLSAPSTPFEVNTPYLTDELFEIQCAQNADTMFLVHPNHKPRTLTRTSATTFVLANFTPTADPFTSSGNYPRTVTFYEQRLWFGGTDNDPQKIFGSKAGDFFDFTTGTADDDAFTFTIAGNEVSIINWLAGMSNSLVIGTLSGNFSGTGGGTNQAITPTNISIKPTDFEGADYQTPVYKDNKLIYVQQGGIVVRSYSFDILSENFTSSDLNIVADDITISGVKQLSYKKGRPEIIWGIKNDGDLIGLTFNDTENVFGWHLHDTQGLFTSADTLSEPNGVDTLFTVVNRIINGSSKYYLEYLNEPVQFSEKFDFFTDTNNQESDSIKFLNKVFEEQKEYIHLDSTLTYDGTSVGSDASANVIPSAFTGSGVTFTASAAVFASGDIGREIWKKSITGDETGRATITGFTSTTVVTCDISVDFDNTNTINAGDWYLTADNVTGLDHLESETVNIMTDGSTAGNAIVTSGEVSIPAQASVIHIGLSYKGIMITNSLEAGGVIGPSQTKPKDLYELGIRFADTLGAQFGTDLYNMQFIDFRDSQSFIDRPPPPLSGDVELFYKDRTELDKKVVVLQETAAPCIIQLLVPYLFTSDE